MLRLVNTFLFIYSQVICHTCMQYVHPSCRSQSQNSSTRIKITYQVGRKKYSRTLVDGTMVFQIMDTLVFRVPLPHILSLYMRYYCISSVRITKFWLSEVPITQCN